MSISPPQKILKTRRDYNTWVANEMMEDYALRYAPKTFRKWSEFRVANTALGALSFLVLEAIGGTLMVNYGFENAFWSILVVGLVIFLTGIPISYYASRYSLDMDLLTRGAGFGYLGSTITSLIYASFTFIFFALEAAIMSLALELYFGLPLAIGYIVSSLVIIPLVTHGVTWISRLQTWTQPVWIGLSILPFLCIALHAPELMSDWTTYAGRSGEGRGFSLLAFGAASTIAFSLIVQIGEQVDYLRFLPDKTAENRTRWWLANLSAGAGWIVPGMIKQFAGAFLAFVAIQHQVPLEKATEPTQMYFAGFSYVFSDPAAVGLITMLFVVVSQLKINVTNAYAGSLAWSNFFSRLTHSHPGRVVWLTFNVVIAVLLMELGVFGALERVLSLYSNIAIAWVGALVADLVINKPLGLSPSYIEFKRGHLYDINPVGVGSMLVASMASIAAYMGCFGATARAFAPFIALTTAFLLAPLIAFVTRGRFYVARPRPPARTLEGHACGVCGQHFEVADKTYCPFYEDVICSLCCTLDVRCGDACKPSSRIGAQAAAVVGALLPGFLSPGTRARIGHYAAVFSTLALVTGAVVGVIFYQEVLPLGPDEWAIREQMESSFLKIYIALMMVMGIGAWWLVLTEESRRAAQDESNKQTGLLLKEIKDHQATDAQLQQAKEAADQANRAKSRFLGGMSHELRGPLNSVLGYTEILMGDSTLAEHHREGLGIVRQSGEHLLNLVDDILDIARIEARKLQLRRQPFDFGKLLEQLENQIRLEARRKELTFRCRIEGRLPAAVRGDEKRVRQILSNLLSNAVKFTLRGSVELSVRYASEIAHFEVRDTGVGIESDDLERIFQPFQRVTPASLVATEGAGLGLTVTRMLTDLMGGELTVISQPGVGTTFRARLYLPGISGSAIESVTDWVRGYEGPRRSILVTDDQAAQRAMLANLLTGLGFSVTQADSGESCVEAVKASFPDLILLDRVMHGMDGLTTLQVLRNELGFQRPVIMVSANAFETDRKEALAAGCDDYVVKPVRLSELKNKLEAHLQLRWRFDESSGHEPLRETVSGREMAEPEIPVPNAETLSGLLHFAQIGYVSGIVNILDEMSKNDARYAPFADKALALAKQFRLRELQELFSRG